MANKTLERTTGENDLGLEPEDPNKWSHHFYQKQWLTKGFNTFNLYSLKVFSSIYDPYQALLLPLKAIVSCISRTCDFWPKRSLYTSVYSNFLVIDILSFNDHNDWFCFFVSIDIIRGDVDVEHVNVC